MYQLTDTQRIAIATNGARMATDTLTGLQRIDTIVSQWHVGLVSTTEAINMLRSV